MMKRMYLAGIVIAACLTRPGLADQAAQIKDLFDAMFADKIKAVLATSTREDDAHLAGEILKAAQETNGPEALTIYLYEKTYEFASRDPRSFRWAADALGRLAEMVPDRTLEMQEKLLELYTIAFRNSKGPGKVNLQRYEKAGNATIELMSEVADAKVLFGKTTEARALLRRAAIIAGQVNSPLRDTIKSKLADLNRRLILERRINQYMDRLKADPTDKDTADKLVQIYLVQLDEPRSAARWGWLSMNATDLKMTRLAAEQLGQFNEADTLALADWYRGLANKAGPDDKSKMLIRARLYYEHFIWKTTEDDPGRLKARLALQTVNNDLDRLGVQGLAAARLVQEKRQIVGLYTPAKPTTPQPGATLAKVDPKSPAPRPTNPTARTATTSTTPPTPDSPDKPRFGIVSKPNAKPTPSSPSANPGQSPDAAANLPGDAQIKYMVPGDYWEGRKSIFDFGWDK